MNGSELVKELKQPGRVMLWVPELDDYVELVKVVLRKSVESIEECDRDDLDIVAERDEACCRAHSTLFIESIDRPEDFVVEEEVTA